MKIKFSVIIRVVVMIKKRLPNKNYFLCNFEFDKTKLLPSPCFILHKAYCALHQYCINAVHICLIILQYLFLITCPLASNLLKLQLQFHNNSIRHLLFKIVVHTMARAVKTLMDRLQHVIRLPQFFLLPYNKCNRNIIANY